MATLLSLPSLVCCNQKTKKKVTVAPISFFGLLQLREKKQEGNYNNVHHYNQKTKKKATVATVAFFGAVLQPENKKKVATKRRRRRKR